METGGSYGTSAVMVVTPPAQVLLSFLCQLCVQAVWEIIIQWPLSTRVVSRSRRNNNQYANKSKPVIFCTTLLFDIELKFNRFNKFILEIFYRLLPRQGSTILFSPDQHFGSEVGHLYNSHTREANFVNLVTSDATGSPSEVVRVRSQNFHNCFALTEGFNKPFSILRSSS